MNNHKYYIPLEIPDFDDVNLNQEDVNKCKILFEEIAISIRNRCGIFEQDIAYHTICKLKETIIESMKLNLEMVKKEYERRKNFPIGNSHLSD